MSLINILCHNLKHFLFVRFRDLLKLLCPFPFFSPAHCFACKLVALLNFFYSHCLFLSRAKHMQCAGEQVHIKKLLKSFPISSIFTARTKNYVGMSYFFIIILFTTNNLFAFNFKVESKEGMTSSPSTRIERVLRKIHNTSRMCRGLRG